MENFENKIIALGSGMKDGMSTLKRPGQEQGRGGTEDEDKDKEEYRYEARARARTRTQKMI